MFLRVSPELYGEGIETTLNGVKASEALWEFSIPASLTGSILGPQFMRYEVGVRPFWSRLTGSVIEVRDRELDYNILASFFPGRRLSVNLLASRTTSQLRDNLLLFNRNRYTELGGELLLQEGERMPSLGFKYYHRNRVTSNERTVFLLPTLFTSRELVEHSESSSETDLFLDKRNKDLQYHLGFLRDSYDSKDFGYSTTTDYVNFDLTRWLMKRRLQVNLRGDVFRTRTDTRPSKFLGSATVIDDEEEVGRGTGFFNSSEFTSTETDLGLELTYRGTRFDHDASYDWNLVSARGFKTTQQEGNLATTYRISDKTTLRASYATVLTDSPNSGNRSQYLNLRLSRNMTPNLVFYVEGDGETIRSNTSNAGEFLNLVVSVCGNGVLEHGEQCDDGNTTDGDGCSSTCRNERVPACGDGILERGEQCDDGNTANGDGCSSICRSELLDCGDGHLDAGEQCDDGNKTNGDGCSSICQRETSRRFQPQDVTRADLDVGADYSRRLGNFTAYSNLELGAGHATLSPGGSGIRTKVQASLGVTGTAFLRINLAGNLYYDNETDASGFAPDLQQSTAQVIATRFLGRRLQLRARAFATNINQDRTKQVEGQQQRSFDTPLVFDERQRIAEIGLATFLPRGTSASLAVGRQSTVSNVGRGDIEDRFNYLTASLIMHPLRHLEVVGSARIQRGFQLNDIQDDRDFIELDAIYHLREWSFELGYTRNQYILATSDYEQKRVYFTVRRDFGWRLR